MSGRIDALRWEKGYGMGWKKARGELVGRQLRGVDPSFDAGAAEAIRDAHRLERARRADVRPHGDLRRPGTGHKLA